MTPLITDVTFTREGALLSNYNETQASETECTEACWTNYPRSEAKWDQRPKLQKQSALKLAGRIIPEAKWDQRPKLQKLKYNETCRICMVSSCQCLALMLCKKYKDYDHEKKITIF